MVIPNRSVFAKLNAMGMLDADQYQHFCLVTRATTTTPIGAILSNTARSFR
jgi:hypothetical protein